MCFPGLPPGGPPETTFVAMPAQDTAASNTVSTLDNVQDVSQGYFGYFSQN